MNRKERRKNGDTKKVATYNFTEEQLQAYIRNHYEEVLKEEKEQTKEELKQELLPDLLILTLTLPLEVLMKYYWPKSYETRLPGFVNRVIEYFSKWENGELSIEQMRKDLWDYGGVRLERMYEEGDQNE